MRSILGEFKEFIAKGNAIDLAVGVVVGAAFTAIVKSLVDDIVMPIIGLLMNRVDFTNLFLVLREGSEAAPYKTLAAAQETGAVVFSYGVFINAVVSFLIIAFVVFLMVKAINHLRSPEGPLAMRDCPYCLTSVPAAATRCSACASDLEAA